MLHDIAHIFYSTFSTRIWGIGDSSNSFSSSGQVSALTKLGTPNGRKHTATRVLLQLQARSTTNQIDVWWTNDIGVKIHLRLFLAANPATSSPAFCEKVLKTLPNASQEKYQTNRLYNSHDFSKSRQRQCTQKGMLSSQARTRRSRRTSPCLPSLLAWSKRSLDAFYV